MWEQTLNWLRTLPLWKASLGLLLQNLIVFALALLFGHLFVRLFRNRRVADIPPPLSQKEISLATCTVLLNTVITIIGWHLWRIGIVNFLEDVGVWVLVDIVILFFVMDFAMYALHRTAHLPIFFPVLHRTHHEYENPRPLTLFVLNPAETLSFGGLWLAVICCYSFSWIGMSVYLVLNVVFGTIGHLGVEPFPSSWRNIPVLRYVSTGLFHVQHHKDLNHNYGFYTAIWDKLFKTLQTNYFQESRTN
jgi:sterol desaturase/sphingolipid hydroxylase (fatty acid hydroxylase superfamily)